MSYTTKVATAVCKALGMPARFAAEKEPVSPTLAASTSDYMRGLAETTLNKISGNRRASVQARNAAAAELSRRRVTA